MMKTTVCGTNFKVIIISLAVIGTNTIGITEVDWLGLLSACALSGVVTVLFNIKSLPEERPPTDKKVS
ncbi:MAG: hypothetical protein IJN56_05220 [Clostridia bacterium]|nr:hypothetical protein [Clostridia bacterium]